MIDKKNLFEISGLMLSDVANTLSDSEYARYCELLEDFVDKFPSQEATLKEHCKTCNYEGFVDVLMELKGTLIKIHADDFALKCDGLLKIIKDPNRDMADAVLLYFLTSLSMLSIEIQMAKHKKEPSASSGDMVFENKEDNKQINILAVDDVPLLLGTLRAVLQETDYKFTGVTSGEAALKFIAGHKVDLFLLDIEMPGMNGYELTQKIKASGQTAPIIFLTGNAKREYVVKAMQLGAADFIVKPVNKDQVLEKIKKFIG